MIISRTPFRISFFGGGTDYPEYYLKYGGQVLGTSIDKYCYISIRHLPPFFTHKHRIVYSRVEYINELSKIKHPVVRAVLQHLNVQEGLEIHHDADLPARSGIGSSSSFSVGFLHAMKAFHGEMVMKSDLALSAMKLERDILNECVGHQDQMFAAHGGFNKISFRQDGVIDLEPVTIAHERLEQFHSHLMLFFTGFSRHASEVAKSQIQNINKRKKHLKRMGQMVDEAILILNNPKTSIDKLGKLLHEAWSLKRNLSNKVTTNEIDAIYEQGLQAGAIGGEDSGSGRRRLYFVLCSAGVSVARERKVAQIGARSISF